MYITYREEYYLVTTYMIQTTQLREFGVHEGLIQYAVGLLVTFFF